MKELLPVERPKRSRFILKICNTQEGSTLQQGKNVRKKEQQRGDVTD